MKILEILKKSEIYFLLLLFALNLYLAFALREDQIVNSTHLMMSVIMLIFVNDKISNKKD